MAKRKSSKKAHPTGLVECTNEEYHGGPGESKSRLDAMAAGPRIYWQNYVNPDRPPREYKPAWALGTATHSAILEPDLFGTEFVVAPEFNLRKPDERAQLEQLHVDCATRGQTVVSRDHYDLACAMRDTVYAHPVAGPLLGDMRRAGARAEQSYFAEDPETGLLVKCRFDYLAPSTGQAVDLKTARGAVPRAFSKSIEQYRYDVQEAWYRRVYMLAMEGCLLESWIFLAVESTAPHQVGLYRLPQDIVRAATRTALRDLHQIAECKAMGIWPDPGYAGVIELPLSNWHRKGLGIEDPDNEFPDED